MITPGDLMSVWYAFRNARRERDRTLRLEAVARAAVAKAMEDEKFPRLIEGEFVVEALRKAKP